MTVSWVEERLTALKAQRWTGKLVLNVKDGEVLEIERPLEVERTRKPKT